MKPRFFATPEAFRAWLLRNHASSTELIVVFRKRSASRPGMSWPQSVDEALCFGWIDGVRRRIDEESYSIRFTPRREGSRWSAVNIRRVPALEAEGRMRPAGRAAFARRVEGKSRTYSYEREDPARLDAALAKILESDSLARDFLRAQAPWYQRKVVHWVMSAKSEEIRKARLLRGMAAFARGRRM